jgi:organic hydroperoxide reductase OsmC/OhrA
MKKHQYSLQMNWIGNTGTGTASYNSYSRNHEYKVPGKPVLAGSSDPAFKGDPSRYNPEELLVASLSSCHMLWFLHLCSVAGIVVISYEDQPAATMEEDAYGAGRFTDAVLRPRVVIAGGDPEKATALHHKAHEFCFIAQSVNFPVRCEGTITVENKL